MRIFELRQKEVINIGDGRRLGYIDDVEIDEEKGVIKSAVIPSAGKVFGIFGKETEYIVPWDCITRMGEDIVLVDYAFPPVSDTKKTRSRKTRFE